MSSSKSLAPRDAGLTLRDAFVDVCENSFFAYVETCDARKFAELAAAAAEAHQENEQNRQVARRPVQSEWLKAAVGFGGAFPGAIELVLPEQLARSLVGSILGAEPETELPEHQIFDGLGEFANMICGAWLTTLAQRQTFELRPPAVTRMANGWTPMQDSTWNDEQGHRLAVNELPVRLRFRSLAA
jgi:CheY-specific phosphatase CheX